jgi:hypothetical protein
MFGTSTTHCTAWLTRGPRPAVLQVFFVSYSYMDHIVSRWHDMGVLQEVMKHKLIFIETQVG